MYIGTSHNCIHCKPIVVLCTQPYLPTYVLTVRMCVAIAMLFPYACMSHKLRTSDRGNYIFYKVTVHMCVHMYVLDCILNIVKCVYPLNMLS